MQGNTRPRRRTRQKGLLSATVRLCPSMTACDGTTLMPGYEICAACRQAVERRQKRKDALRGERYVTYSLSRGKIP